jgi:hypothetical protein
MLSSICNLQQAKKGWGTPFPTLVIVNMIVVDEWALLVIASREEENNKKKEKREEKKNMKRM